MAFAARCVAAADDGADAAAVALRDKYEPRVRRAQRAIETAADRLDVAETEAAGRRNEELLTTAGGVLGAIFGRSRVKGALGSLGRSAGRRTRTSTAGQRADTARNKVADAQEDLETLEQDLADDLEEIEAAWTAKAGAVEEVTVPLEKADVTVVHLGLAWVPTG